MGFTSGPMETGARGKDGFEWINLEGKTLPALEVLDDYMPGELFILQEDGGERSLLYANQVIYSIFGREGPEEFYELTGNTLWGMIGIEEIGHGTVEHRIMLVGGGYLCQCKDHEGAPSASGDPRRPCGGRAGLCKPVEPELLYQTPKELIWEADQKKRESQMEGGEG